MPTMPTALLIDDDEATRRALAKWLAGERFEVRTADSLEQAREQLTKSAPDFLLVDLELPDGNGIELIKNAQELPATETVVVTGHGTIDSAVTAMRDGAIDFITKPVDVQRLRRIAKSIHRTAALRREVRSLRGQLRELGRFGRILGSSRAMQNVYDLMERVGPTGTNVLVIGETGTGKELVAQTIHELSHRRDRPFLAINCGAVSPSLIETELFGHERGSFTGAQRQHKGIFEQAHGGTLFLDEITEMPADLQVKLLRVLESGQFRRVGGSESHEVDVRVLAATNRDPHEAVEADALREDLLYRIAVFPIQLPPLRERDEDVELIAKAFLERLNQEANAKKRFTREALARLRVHNWPGNVRELRNVVERSFIIAGDEKIDARAIPVVDVPPRPEVNGSNGAREVTARVGMSIADVERRLIYATLDGLDGNKRQAAKILGISLKTLYNRLNKYAKVDVAP